MKILNPEMGETVTEDFTSETGYPKTIISNSAPAWILKDPNGRVICSNYRRDEVEAIAEMVDYLIADEGEHFFSICKNSIEALDTWSNICEYYVAIKCGSNRREVLKTVDLLSYI